MSFQGMKNISFLYQGWVSQLKRSYVACTFSNFCYSKCKGPKGKKSNKATVCVYHSDANTDFWCIAHLYKSLESIIKWLNFIKKTYPCILFPCQNLSTFFCLACSEGGKLTRWVFSLSCSDHILLSRSARMWVYFQERHIKCNIALSIVLLRILFEKFSKAGEPFYSRNPWFIN